MSYKQHILTDMFDDKWLKHYIEKMGEEKFYLYRNKIYNFLSKMQVGQEFKIDDFVEADNIDLFVKITHCFMSEKQYMWLFKNNYQSVKRYWNEEDMERIAAFNRRRRENQNTGGTSVGTES